MFVRTLLAMLFGLLVSVASFASDPWLYSGRIGGTFVYNAMSDAVVLKMYILTALTTPLLQYDTCHTPVRALPVNR